VARLSPDNVQRARATIARYPQSRSACIPLLHLAQEQDGHLTDEAMVHVAELLGITAAEVLGTASFYEMFKREETGRYLLGICTNIACLLRGAYELLEHAEGTLGIKSGGITDDGLFSLEENECLAACGGAPCLQVNYRYVENVTPEQLDAIVDDLRAGRGVAETVPSHGTLSRVPLPAPVTPADRVVPEEIHAS
jgi:NADH-quinone oxidoreductase subunit E